VVEANAMSKKTQKVVKEKAIVPPEMYACLDDKGENYIVEIELPGVSKKNIELNMHEDLVLVKAERSDLTFLGHMHFPLKVNPKKAEAAFTQGLLMAKVPIKEKRAPPLSIKIK
jgi:HSP20 family molecular chaperone IbpA